MLLEAVVIEPHMRLVVRREVLPGGKDGRLQRVLGRTRVVQLSDLHVRNTGPRERKLARLLESLKPDLLLMTGDFGDRGRDVELEALVRLVSTARPSLGAYAVLGNNDYYRGKSGRVRQALEAAGVRVLVNESVIVETPGGRLAIAGVDDPHFGRDDAVSALVGIDPEVPVILLAHAPEILEPGRSRGMQFNAGDSDGPFGRGWFWVDGAHFRKDGPVVFPTNGGRRVRVQRREDGVEVSEIRLVPTDGTGRPVVIKASDVKEIDIHGSWRMKPVGGIVAMVDGPDRGLKQDYPEIEPASWFEAGFEAEGGVPYEVRVHLRSPTRRGTSDSLYVQFSDSLDVRGNPVFRIGAPAPRVDSSRVDLLLAGHTHGGQVRLPWIGALAPSVRNASYDRGEYRVDDMTLFVSSGVGWSWLPVRLGCPPEVVVFETKDQEKQTEYGSSLRSGR